ncbi:MAG: hypothetical protein JWP49_2925 [Phenylobacterium sp.]|nr:hypothetical protein [Phenylobacterium sp.]
MSAQSLSTATSTPSYGPLLRRALAKASLTSVVIVAAVFAVAAGPILVQRPTAFALAIFRTAPLHAPDLGPILHAGPAIQIHLATLLVAFAATAVLMTGVKGSRLHRVLGWTWAATMLTTAVATLFIRAAPFGPHIGPFGVLHVFALLTFLSVPRAVLAARRHDVASHAGIISGFVIGGLGIAGLAAFLPGRLMWAVFFG